MNWGLFILAVFALILIAAIAVASNSDERGSKKKKKLSPPENLESQRRYIRHVAEKYKHILARKRTQLICEDDYGDIEDTKWREEIVKFYTAKVKSGLEDLITENGYARMAETAAASGSILLDKVLISASEIAEIIDSVAEEEQKAKSELFEYDAKMTGIEYEHYCAELLRKSAWEAIVSQASNDQGVDIVAKLNGKTVAIQCKRYSKPVGNKAVQEIVSGSIFYEADYAVVVTDQSYTPSAIQLAKVSNVLLLHHSDLPSLETLIPNRPGAAPA